MFIRQTEYDLLLEQKRVAEARAAAAESALAAERQERMKDVRHIMSMWLRHSKALPLPATKEERAEADEVKKNAPPPPLNPTKQAQWDALKSYALANGIPVEEAQEKFEAMSDLEQ